MGKLIGRFDWRDLELFERNERLLIGGCSWFKRGESREEKLAFSP